MPLRSPLIARALPCALWTHADCPAIPVFRYNACNVDVPRRRPRRRPALWTRQEQERHINGTRDSTDQSMCSEPEALPRTHTCKVTLVGVR